MSQFCLPNFTAREPRELVVPARTSYSLVHFAKGCQDFNLLPTNGFSIKPRKVKLLAGEQKAAKYRCSFLLQDPKPSRVRVEAWGIHHPKDKKMVADVCTCGSARRELLHLHLVVLGTCVCWEYAELMVWIGGLGILLAVAESWTTKPPIQATNWRPPRPKGQRLEVCMHHHEH